jgi:outer membrane biosynthesis protein TonB
VFTSLNSGADDADPPATDEPTSQTTDEPAAEEPAEEEPAEEQTEEPAEEPTSEPTTKPTKKPTKAPPANPAAQTRRDVTAFIGSYLATATSNPESSYNMLTPGFQADSGGLGSYSGYWRTIATATPSNIVVDPAALTVSYDVDYVRVDGTTATGSTTLQLQRAGNGYLIADEF